jgi:hypothetical protein
VSPSGARVANADPNPDINRDQNKREYQGQTAAGVYKAKWRENFIAVKQIKEDQLTQMRSDYECNHNQSN